MRVEEKLGTCKRHAASKLLLATLIIAAALAPGFWWPVYFPTLGGALFFGMLLIVLRVYLAAGVSFRRAQGPPPLPDGAEWPFVSVLVPAYNEASVLPRTMESMRRLDYRADRIEFVYVYEKRSTDGTNDIIRAYERRDPRFRGVERDGETGGKAAATNAGIAACRGELVFSLDADHIIDSGAVKRAARWFVADSNLACLKGRAIGMNGHESVLAQLAKVERDIAEKTDIYMRGVLRSFTIFGGGQAVFRRSIFAQIGPFDEEILVEDIDFSVRIHVAGRGLVVDPGVVTFEENPPTLAAWWAQRERWARGWMQVARRYLPRIHRMERLTWRQRVDMYHTFAYVIVPIAFILFVPLTFLGLFGMSVQPFESTWASIAWMSFAAAPFVASLAVVVQDLRDGIPRSWRELPAVIALWPYLIFQTGVFWSGFLDEFVLRRPSVYVKTAKSGADARPPDLRNL